MMYSSETWATKKKDEKRLDVVEMRMLRWQCGVTLRDKVRNEHLRGSLKITSISNKIKENRLRWYGHVKRRDENHPTRKILEFEPTGRRALGRPRTRWKDSVKRAMEEVGLTEFDTQDRRQ